MPERAPQLYLTVTNSVNMPLSDVSIHYLFYVADDLVVRNASIAYGLAESSDVVIAILNAFQDTVARSVTMPNQPPGNHVSFLDGSSLTNGVYEYRVITQDSIISGSFFLRTDDLAQLRQTTPFASTNSDGKRELTYQQLGIGKTFNWSSGSTDFQATIADSISLLLTKPGYQDYFGKIRLDMQRPTDITIELSQ